MKQNRENNIAAAQETLKIIKDGKYKAPNGQTVVFNADSPQCIYEVVTYSPEASEKLLPQIEKLRGDAGEKRCAVSVVEADSFEAARRLNYPLVMNFASARHPGGGFLKGASAQEESLCRDSTLYASISSEKAGVMYDYNSTHYSEVYSDYMLISPNVYVFRGHGSLLNEPFRAAVVTVAAPNRRPDNGPARGVPGSVLYEVMKTRLRKMFCAAVDGGYKELVLGAWGCGAFANDPRDVAKMFRELLFEERYEVFFDTVCFAVKGRGENLDAFTEAFS